MMQCKKLDPLVTGNIGSFCVDCLQDTNFLDAQVIRHSSLLTVNHVTEMYTMETSTQATEKVGYVVIAIGMSATAVTRRSIVMRIVHLMTFMEIMNLQSSLMVHTEFTTIV